jgi:hypothetical protein
METIGIDIGATHSTVINWPNQVKQIVDGYRSYSSISHGIQKDAIQNSWDARIDKSDGKGWGIEFELFESKGKDLLTFTDFGTTGLTGRVLMPEDLEKDLPIVERWGRFENVAFTKDPSEHALGARGRGKFIFVGASGFKGISQDGRKIEKLILYDTLRKDKVYRFGLRFITTTDSRVQAFENEEAILKLEEFTNGMLSPLKKIGTRVIIVDPLEEVIQDVKNGLLLQHIEETWWEIIDRLGAKITVIVGEEKIRAKLPKRMKFPENDTPRFKTWTKRNVKLPQAPQYSIEELKIVYDSELEIPEEIRGISIQRGGMKVCSIPPKYVDKVIANSICGYIKLDTELETKVQEDEGIEHYSFDFKKQLPKLIKQFIEDELDKFLREKLNIGQTPQTNYSGQKSAELKALYQVNKIAQKLGILGKGVSGLVQPKTTELQLKPLRLSFGRFEFPSNSQRVNYGEAIKNINLNLKNDTLITRHVGVRFSVLFDETEEVYNFIDNEEFKIGPTSEQMLLENRELEIDGQLCRYKGKYSFVARLVSMEDANRGNIIHTISRHFWVEEDPPQRGIFEEIEPVDYPKDLKAIMGEAVKGESAGYKFLYNISHPAKKVAEIDENSLMRYLIELMCSELAWIDLRSVEPKLFTKDDLDNPANIIKRLNKFLGEVKHNIY